jgi:hypothetical protein
MGKKKFLFRFNVFYFLASNLSLNFYIAWPWRLSYITYKNTNFIYIYTRYIFLKKLFSVYDDYTIKLLKIFAIWSLKGSKLCCVSAVALHVYTPIASIYKCFLIASFADFSCRFFLHTKFHKKQTMYSRKHQLHSMYIMFDYPCLISSVSSTMSDYTLKKIAHVSVTLNFLWSLERFYQVWWPRAYKYPFQLNVQHM